MSESQATPRPPETPEFGLVSVGGPVHDYPAEAAFRVEGRRRLYENDVYAIVAGEEALIVDGADEPERLDLVEGLAVKGILQTHNHGDHVQALAAIDALDVPSSRIPVTRYRSSSRRGGRHVPRRRRHRDRPPHPGAHAGSVCYALGSYLFSGDTLFPAGPGRTDGPERFAGIMRSLDRLFAELPDDTRVCPGHGIDTTIGRERPHVETWRARGW